MLETGEDAFRKHSHRGESSLLASLLLLQNYLSNGTWNGRFIFSYPRDEQSLISFGELLRRCATRPTGVKPFSRSRRLEIDETTKTKAAAIVLAAREQRVSARAYTRTR